jgi:hypothetical protein
VNVLADTPVRIGIVDGINAVVPSSVRLWFDEDDVTSSAAITDTTDGVLATYTTGVLPGQTAHTIRVQFMDDASPANVVDKEWTFTTAGYANLPPGLATGLGTGADPGMKWRTHQIASGSTTTIAAAEQQLAGSLGPSIHISTDPGKGVAWTDAQGTDGFYVLNFINI